MLLASYYGRFDLVTILVARNPQAVNIGDDDGLTPLGAIFTARRPANVAVTALGDLVRVEVPPGFNDERIGELLLSHGADIFHRIKVAMAIHQTSETHMPKTRVSIRV